MTGTILRSRWCPQQRGFTVVIKRYRDLSELSSLKRKQTSHPLLITLDDSNSVSHKHRSGSHRLLSDIPVLALVSQKTKLNDQI